MNREIKFRAWNETDKRLEQVKQVTFLKDGTTLVVFETQGELRRTLSNPRLMQFTGLQDKNGKDIYEGDKNGRWVVKFGEYTLERFANYDLSGIRAHIGFYIHQEAYHMELSNSPQKIYHREESRVLTSDFIVKGNIYENPELLES